MVDLVTTGPPESGAFDVLMPFLEPSEDWAARWTLVIAEVERRSHSMGWESAIASVCDDLRARRL